MRPCAGDRKGVKRMMDGKAKKKTWQITVERSSGITDEYIIDAGTLHEAFNHFSEFLFPWNMVGIRISEASA